MEIILSRTYVTPVVEAYLEKARELNLIRFASEAAGEMEFEDTEEFQAAVKRAMEICIQAGLPLKGNFQRIYKCSYHGIEFDWKLSALAYGLVCLNGGSGNPRVAEMQVGLLKNRYIHNG